MLVYTYTCPGKLSRRLEKVSSGTYFFRAKDRAVSMGYFPERQLQACAIYNAFGDESSAE
jgi:hypothetical protein